MVQEYPIGIAIDLDLAAYSHSCKPNVFMRWNGRVVTLIPLEEGLDASDTKLARISRHHDEFNMLAPTEVRQQYLRAFSCVDCWCDRCRDTSFFGFAQKGKLLVSAVDGTLVPCYDWEFPDSSDDIGEFIGFGYGIKEHNCDRRRIGIATRHIPFKAKHTEIVVSALLLLPNSDNLFRTAVLEFILDSVPISRHFIKNPVVIARLREEYTRYVLRCFPKNYGGHSLRALMILGHDLIRAKRIQLASIIFDEAEEWVGKLWPDASDEGDELAVIERLDFLYSCIRKKIDPPPVADWERNVLYNAVPENSFATHLCDMFALGASGGVLPIQL